MLQPVTNQSRLALSLNGLWNFSLVDIHYNPIHPLENSRMIGVPGSYNDLFTEKEIRDYVGKVCYEKTIEVPSLHTNWRLRIGAAGHKTDVYLDGILIGSHNGGFLPIDLPLEIHESSSHRLSVILDNRVGFDTLPIGEIDGMKQTIHFDFKNYSGIHRNVYCYSVPNNYIEDMMVESFFEQDGVYLEYSVKTDNEVRILIKDPNNFTVYQGEGSKGRIKIDHPILWGIGKGNLYSITATTDNDTYTELFGIRKIEIKESKLYLNDAPIYLQGFGMHEDHDTIGKGSVSALNIRDFELLQWIHANSFRTSHYPYAEEMYDIADKMGILIINEMPAVGMNFWDHREVFTEERCNKTLQEIYIKQFDELIARDKNHPSIIMYSLANEAKTNEDNAYLFFKDIFAHAREKTKLPLMIVEVVGAKENKVAQLADVIGMNRYIGWYVNFSELDTIEKELSKQIEEYYTKFNKPILLSEFGTDTISGLHRLPSVAFSEEFQVEFIQIYRTVLKKYDYIIGEHLWNFADFDTKQGITRIDGNKKGIFTRNRQPKMIAHILRKEWENSNK